ncbi:MAG: GNAT family N-acetyltransferase [Pseudomonadota bacterium]
MNAVALSPERCAQPPKGAPARAALQHQATVPVIETERLRLRAPRLDDLPLWTEIFAGPQSRGLKGPHGPDVAWTEFSTYSACWMLHGFGLWSVETRDAQRLIGFVFIGLEWGDLEPELGYLFAPDGQGQGYATEAARAARDWALEQMQTFVSYVSRSNDASNRLAARIGATRDLDAEAAIEAAEGSAPHVWRHGARV